MAMSGLGHTRGTHSEAAEDEDIVRGSWKPAGHEGGSERQLATETAPRPRVTVLSGQAVQSDACDAPTMELYELSGQSVHVVVDALLAYEPAGQREHSDAPAGEK